MSADKSEVEGLPIRYYHGHPMPGPTFLKEECVESAMKYQPHDGDIVVCGFPQTGVVWTSYIVDNILNKKDSLPEVLDMVTCLFPFMEKVGAEGLDTLQKPRAYCTYIPGNILKINDKAKYIYLHRKPEDTLMAYYHANQRLVKPKYDLKFFFERYMGGKVPHGDIFHHALSFYSHKNKENFLFISFEDLRKDTRAQVLRIAKFLGEDYHKSLTQDAERLSKTLELVNLDYLKNNLFFTQAQAREDGKGGVQKIPAFDMGEIGDGKKFLSKEQLEKVEEKVKNKMEGTEFIELWSSN